MWFILGALVIGILFARAVLDWMEWMDKTKERREQAVFRRHLRLSPHMQASGGRVEMKEATVRILVTGSREWTDWDRMREMLKMLTMDVDMNEVVVVHGGARGADRIAGKVARRLGYQTEEHPAQWDELGKSAGYRRNEYMVGLGADYCLAFFVTGAGNRGTRHCADLADRAGIHVTEVWE